MKDETFNRVFKKLEELYVTGMKTDIHSIGQYWYTESNQKRKEHVKQILEEIWNGGYEQYGEDFNNLANGKLKEAE